MISALLRNQKALFFVGGVVATLAGAKVVKSGKAREVAVKGMAAGMKFQKQAHETFVNIREEAQDLCIESEAANTAE